MGATVEGAVDRDATRARASPEGLDAVDAFGTAAAFVTCGSCADTPR